jgi:hypothetical protein
MFKRVTILCCLVFLIAACRSSKRLFNKGQLSSTEVFDVNLPFERDGNLLILNLEIEGESFRFLFDTGAPMVVDKSLRQKFAMQKLSRKKVGDSQGGSQHLDYVLMPTFGLGPLSATGIVAIEADLKSTPGIYCLNIDGIIGANFMRLGFWEINLPDSLVRFTNDFSRIVIDSNASVVPFKIQTSGTPIVSATINDTLIPYITFDTGSNGILGLPSKRVNVLFKDSLSVQSIGYHSAGLFGSKLDTTYSRPVSFALGKDTLAALAIDLEDPGSMSLLGMRYLKNYRVVLNWENQKIYLHRKETSQAISQKRFGLSPFLKDSTMIIGVVAPALLTLQKANKIGLGDTILQINKLDVSYATRDIYCQVSSNLSANDTLTISIKNKGDFLLVKRLAFANQSHDASK